MTIKAPREVSFVLHGWFSKWQVDRILPAVWVLILASLFGCVSDQSPQQSTTESPSSRDQSNGPTIYGKVYAGVTVFGGAGRER